MTDLVFQGWPKIARLFRDCTITEKIDGTNAAVIITDEYEIGAQSRNRLITPADDNFGFARWVHEYADALKDLLGPGHHFGEWWGSGIQRRYGLTNGEKRFSLFNVNRYGDLDFDEDTIPGLGLVPVLDKGDFSLERVMASVNMLRLLGSAASPGFKPAEGVVVFHDAARVPFKVTLENDDSPKGN